MEMRTKYKLIKFSIFEEEKCISMLEKQAAKGWMLEKVGSALFKFKKTVPKRVKFFIDYNPGYQDYVELTSEFGYVFIGNFNSISFWYSDNESAEELQSDPIAKGIAIRTMYKTSVIGVLIFCSLLMIALADPHGYTMRLVRFDIGGVILHQNFIISFVLINSIAIWILLEAIAQIFIRVKISRDMQGLETPMILFYIIKVVHHSVIIFEILILILLLIFDGSFDLRFIITTVIVVGVLMSGRMIRNKIINDHNAKSRKIKTAAVIAGLVIFQLSSSAFLGSSSGDYITIESNSIQSSASNYAYYSSYIFYDETSYVGSGSEQDFSESSSDSYVERIFECRNNFIAEAIFEYQVEEIERDSRVPSEEELDLIEGGFNSDQDIEYKSFDNAILNMKKVESDKIDLGYFIDDHCVLIKDNKVLYVLVHESYNIEDIINAYF